MDSEREKIYQGYFMITLKEAFEDLHDRILKQLAEKIWEKERVKPLEGNAFYDFVGVGVVKEKKLKELDREIKERQGNLKVIKQILKKYADERKSK